MNTQAISRQIKPGRWTQVGGGDSLLRFLIPGRGLGLCFNDVSLGFKSKVFSAQAPTVLTTSLATLQLCGCKLKWL